MGTVEMFNRLKRLSDTQWGRLQAVIRRHPRVVANLPKGEPRPGHPEGSILRHICDLEDNLDRLLDLVSDEEFGKLGVLIMAHDAFKPEAAARVPIADPRSHSSLACAFLKEQMSLLGIPEDDLPEMAQRHDEYFAIWRKLQEKGRVDESRMAGLFSCPIRDWDTFLAFVLIDSYVPPGKDIAPATWFLAEARKRVKTRVDESWAGLLAQANERRG